MTTTTQALDRLLRLLRPHPALRALERAARGEDVYLVGGLLRDRLLGLPSRDADVVVSGGGREIAAAVAAELGATLVPLGADRHAAFRIVGGGLDAGRPGTDGGWVLDLWDRRPMTVEEDLARRDFTVNSFAVRLRDGWVTDPFGGLADLRHRRLRATTEASFRGDPLRVLRLPRLLGALPGFSAGAGTLELARESAEELVDVAAERVRAELALIFRSHDAARSLALLDALGVYPALWSGTLGDMEDGGPETAAAEAVRALAALPTARRVLRTVDRNADDAVHPLAARMALTFAALRGPLAPADAVDRFAAAGYLTRRVAERVQRVLERTEIPPDEIGRRHFLHELGELWPTATVTLGALAGDRELEGWAQCLRPLAELAHRERELLFSPPKLLDGKEVQALLGVPPGPRIGRALAAVRRAQIEGTIDDRAGALALLRRRAEGSGES